MVSPARRVPVLRGLGQVALLPPAALAVHQLRYMLAYGSGAAAELQRQGHAYLHSLVPWITLLLALAAGSALRSLGRALAGHSSLPRYTVSLAGLWLACATSLLAIYICQEFLEGVLSAGHPAGLIGVFGFGGWWSIPAALCIGLVLAAWLHGARWVLAQVAQRRSPRLARSPAPRSARFPRHRPRPRLAPVASGWSGRGPPG